MTSRYLSLLLLVASSAANSADFKAGAFDYYVLALSWEPTFCTTLPGAPECRSARPDRFDADHLVLHGLWPDVSGDAKHAYGYCGVPAMLHNKSDAPRTWCQLPAVPLSDKTKRALSSVMPGMASCLDKHEWYKHGACAGLDADSYFGVSASLVEQVDASSFGRFLTRNAGKTVLVDALVAAFEKDFRPGSRGSLRLVCVPESDKLFEVRLTLTRRLRAGAGLKALLAKSGAADAGACPARIELTPVAAAAHAR